MLHFVDPAQSRSFVAFAPGLFGAVSQRTRPQRLHELQPVREAVQGALVDQILERHAQTTQQRVGGRHGHLSGRRHRRNYATSTDVEDQGYGGCDKGIKLMFHDLKLYIVILYLKLLEELCLLGSNAKYACSPKNSHRVTSSAQLLADASGSNAAGSGTQPGTAGAGNQPRPMPMDGVVANQVTGGAESSEDDDDDDEDSRQAVVSMVDDATDPFSRYIFYMFHC